MDIEIKRLEALRRYGVLDTAAEVQFDRLTSLVACYFKTPIALISLIDGTRQWFKSRVGLDVCETPREQAFCSHALDLGRDGILVVEDATLDERFASNPLVTAGPMIRFYTGVALTTPEGFNLGTLCIIDTKPRARPAAADLAQLQTIARMVVDELELSRCRRALADQDRLLALTEAMSGVGHWRYDAIASQLVWSDEVYRIHGLDRHSFDPNYGSAVSFYHADDQVVVDGLMQRAIADGVGFEFQLRLFRGEGELRHVVARAECERDARGNTSAVVGVFQDITDHIQAVEAAKRNEAHYRLLATNVGDVITRIRLDGSSDYISPSVEHLLGFTALEMAGKPAQAFVHPDDQPMILGVFAELAQGLKQKTVRHRAVRKGGEPIWVETNFHLVRDLRGKPTEMVAVIRDVTDRKILEIQALAAKEDAERQALEACNSERRYRLLAENVTDLIVTSDLKGQILYASPSCQNVLGYPLGELIGSQAIDRTHPDDVSTIRRVFSNLVSGAAPERFRWRAKHQATGDWVWMESKPCLVRDPETNAPVGFLDVIRDATDQHRAEVVIAKSEARYRLLAENATDMIVTSTLEGRTLYVSPASAKLTGYTTDEATGVRTLDLVHPDDGAKMIKAFRALVGGMAPERLRWRGKHKSGGWTWFESMPALVADPATGAPTGFVDVVRDVTAQVRQEEELRQAQAAAEAAAAVKTEFLANMSHELRTPLTSILGFSGLLKGYVDQDGKGANYLVRVTGACEALMSIVNDILDFSKLESGQVEIDRRAVSPASMVDDAVQLLAPQAAAKGLLLTFETKGSLPSSLLLDDNRLRQVILNLTGNAVKFTSTGTVTVRLSYPSERLRCEIVDSGPGIPADRLDRLFQRFSQVDGTTTRTHGGTGLGLAICKGLIEAMGGQVGADSCEGKGSTFWFELPCEAGPSDVSHKAPASMNDPTGVLAGLRLLVADDNPIHQELLRVILASADIDATVVSNGEDALEAAIATPFDLVLIDVHMPGLGGQECARQIRETPGPNDLTPILAFTSEAYAEDLSWAWAFDEVVTNPINASDLFRTIERWAPGGEGADLRGAAYV